MNITNLQILPVGICKLGEMEVFQVVQPYPVPDWWEPTPLSVFYPYQIPDRISLRFRFTMNYRRIWNVPSGTKYG
jgi:hypothetical protein